MGDSPLHPAVVHIPIALAILMPVLSLGLLVAWWKQWLPGRVWFVAVALQGVLVLGTFAAAQTGEQEEDRVEEVLANEDLLEEHEEMGEMMVWATTATFGLMLAPLLLPGDRRRRLAAVVATVATVGVTVVGLYVGKAGGELVYEHGAADAYTGSAGAGPSSDAHDDD
jgi:uncharacterized membrane protein